MIKYLLSLSDNREKILNDFSSVDRQSDEALKLDTKVLLILLYQLLSE